MERDIYCNSLIVKKVKEIEYFFQLDYVIIIYIIKIYSNKVLQYNKKFRKF